MPNFEETEVNEISPSCEQDEQPIAATRPAEVPIVIETIPNFEETPVAATRPAEIPVIAETFPNLVEGELVQPNCKDAPVAGTRPAENIVQIQTIPSFDEGQLTIQTLPAEIQNILENLELETPVINTIPEDVVEEEAVVLPQIQVLPIYNLQTRL